MTLEFSETKQLFEVHQRYLILLVEPVIEELAEMLVPSDEFLELREDGFDDGVVVTFPPGRLRGFLRLHSLLVELEHALGLEKLQLKHIDGLFELDLELLVFGHEVAVTPTHLIAA